MKHEFESLPGARPTRCARPGCGKGRGEPVHLAVPPDGWTHPFVVDPTDPEECDSDEVLCFAARDAAIHRTSAEILAALNPADKEGT